MLKKKFRMPLLLVLFLLSLGACSTSHEGSRKFASEEQEKTYEVEKESAKEPAWKYTNRRYR